MRPTKFKASKWTRFLIGSIFGAAIGILTLVVAEDVIPAQVPSETASSFFFSASGVNATLLVAMAVTISLVMRRYTGRSRRAIMTLFIIELTVVFIGMVAAGLGILIFNPSATFNPSTFKSLVDLVLATWVIGFVLLVAGIWATSFHEIEES